MAYNGKDLEILKEIVSRIQISAQIILSDGRKGFTEDEALKVIDGQIKWKFITHIWSLSRRD